MLKICTFFKEHKLREDDKINFFRITTLNLLSILSTIILDALIQPEQCKLDLGHFLCADNRTCIQRIQVCDGIQHCPDNSDEGVVCNRKDLCRFHNCSHQCILLPSGPKCLCPNGFVSVTEKHCEDINECKTYGVFLLMIIIIITGNVMTFLIQEFAIKNAETPPVHTTVIVTLNTNCKTTKEHVKQLVVKLLCFSAQRKKSGLFICNRNCIPL